MKLGSKKNVRAKDREAEKAKALTSLLSSLQASNLW